MRLEGQNTRVTEPVARAPADASALPGRRRRHHRRGGPDHPVLHLSSSACSSSAAPSATTSRLNNARPRRPPGPSIAANSTDADWQILLPARKEIGAMPLSQVQQVIVFHATGPTSTVPAALPRPARRRPGQGSPNYTDACNVYTGAQFRPSVAADFGCGRATSTQVWCPTDRKFAAQGTAGRPTTSASTSRSSTSSSPVCSAGADDDQDLDHPHRAPDPRERCVMTDGPTTPRDDPSRRRSGR